MGFKLKIKIVLDFKRKKLTVKIQGVMKLR